MQKKKEEKKEKISKENLSLTSSAIMDEISKVVSKEIERRKKSDGQGLDITTLTRQKLVLKGLEGIETQMPIELATMKSMIQSVIRDELLRLGLKKD